MAYTAENIANLTSRGDLAHYIAHERKNIATLEAAEIAETVDPVFSASGEMTYGHLRGNYTAYEIHGKFEAGASMSNSDWSKDWANFQTLNAAAQYARAALRNHLTAEAGRLLAEFRANLVALEGK